MAPATRQKIVEEANRIGYVPNEVARRLQRQQAGIIGMVVVSGTFENDPHFNSIALAASAALNARGYDLILATAPSLDKVHDVYVRLLASRRVDGFIAFAVHCSDEVLDYVEEKRFPFALLGACGRDLARCNHLEAGLAAGSAMALELLHSYGHARVGCLISNITNSFTTARRAVLVEQAREFNLDLTIVPGALDEEGGRACARRIIEGDLDFTALIVPIGRACVGLSIEFNCAGLRIGRDLSVISLGLSPMMAVLEPPITTIAPETSRLAERWAELVIAQCLSATDGIEDEATEPIITHRASVGPPPRRTLKTSA